MLGFSWVFTCSFQVKNNMLHMWFECHPIGFTFGCKWVSQCITMKMYGQNNWSRVVSCFLTRLMFVNMCSMEILYGPNIFHMWLSESLPIWNPSAFLQKAVWQHEDGLQIFNIMPQFKEVRKRWEAVIDIYLLWKGYKVGMILTNAGWWNLLGVTDQPNLLKDHTEDSSI